jgi:hypothetical protein
MPSALARAIVEVAPLGDNAVQRRSGLSQPFLGLCWLGRGWRESDPSAFAKIRRCKLLELVTPCLEGFRHKRATVYTSEKIEDDEDRGSFSRKTFYPRGCRMNALE